MTPVLKLINAETWLSELSIRNSKIFVFNSSLDESYTNFCKHALFVPTIYKMAISSLKPLPLYYFTKSNSVIILNVLKKKSEEPLHLTNLDSKFDVIPKIRVNNNRLNVYMQNQ